MGVIEQELHFLDKHLLTNSTDESAMNLLSILKMALAAPSGSISISHAQQALSMVDRLVPILESEIKYRDVSFHARQRELASFIQQLEWRICRLFIQLYEQQFEPKKSFLGTKVRPKEELRLSALTIWSLLRRTLIAHLRFFKFLPEGFWQICHRLWSSLDNRLRVESDQVEKWQIHLQQYRWLIFCGLSPCHHLPNHLLNQLLEEAEHLASLLDWQPDWDEQCSLYLYTNKDVLPFFGRPHTMEETIWGWQHQRLSQYLKNTLRERGKHEEEPDLGDLYATLARHWQGHRLRAIRETCQIKAELVGSLGHIWHHLNLRSWDFPVLDNRPEEIQSQMRRRHRSSPPLPMQVDIVDRSQTGLRIQAEASNQPIRVGELLLLVGAKGRLIGGLVRWMRWESAHRFTAGLEVIEGAGQAIMVRPARANSVFEPAILWSHAKGQWLVLQTPIYKRMGAIHLANRHVMRTARLQQLMIQTTQYQFVSFRLAKREINVF